MSKLSAENFEDLASKLASIRPAVDSAEYVLWAQAAIAVSDHCQTFSDRFKSDKFRHACMTRESAVHVSGAAAVRRIAE